MAKQTQYNEGITRTSDYRLMPSLRPKIRRLARLMSAFSRQRSLPSGKLYLAEAAGYVAPFAILAEPSTVDVITAVTADAPASSLGRIAGLRMASGTDQPLVLPGKGKVALRVVIETPGLPVERVVAIATGRGRTQSSAVVIVGVAACTGCALGRKAAVDVAALALQLGMFAQQRKPRQAVVEPDAFLPAFAVVAATAIVPQVPRVGIVLLVARAAIE